MVKYIFLIVMSLGLISCAGDKPYDEHADAGAGIQQAKVEAKQQNKPLLIIFGANWCSDCRALNNAIEQSQDAIRIANEFKIVKVNVGNFDKNLEIVNAYGNPIAGGIPGAAILAADHSLLYVTKPGELSNAIRARESSLYTFLTNHVNTTNGIIHKGS